MNIPKGDPVEGFLEGFSVVLAGLASLALMLLPIVIVIGIIVMIAKAF